MTAPSHVENGRRVTFEHPSSAGPAALVEYEGKVTLAYSPRDRGGNLPAVGDEVAVEGAPYRVLTMTRLRKLSLVKLGLEAISAA